MILRYPFAVPDQTLLFGATSILGYNLAISADYRIVPFVPPHQKAIITPDSADNNPWQVLNLEDTGWIRKQLDRYQPDTLIYCHAVCDVAKCQANPSWAYQINVGHVERLLDALPQSVRLIYISSDHVFSGDFASGVYNENTPPCPISVYGQSRVDAESAIADRDNTLIIRAGLAIGPSPQGKTGHHDWLRYRSERDLPITIIQDEARSVYWAQDLVHRVMQFSASRETGLVHIQAHRAVSRVELATYLMQTWGKEPSCKLQSRTEQPTPHLGHVELATVHTGEHHEPLPPVITDTT